MTEPRLYAGLVQMVRQENGTTDIQNEHWTSWCTTKEAALGAWIISATEKWQSHQIAYHACYDITDVALQLLQRPGGRDAA